MVDKMLGKTLENRYLIEELIGVGGMANVYKGFDRVGQRVVAIKILREEYTRNEEFLRRFRDESRAIYSLNHPGIVKVYDVILDSSSPCLVMEFVDGITLKEYILRNGSISIKQTFAIIIKLLKALNHAHENGIVHRDVKPQNVMLQIDETLKIMDFGIARFAMSQSRTISRQAIGSVHYISPEQARGEESIDQRSDIYSVGIILYEMLTGRLPFEGDNPIAVALKQTEEIPTPPSLLNSRISQGLEEIVMKAMAKKVENRYFSIVDMMEDIRALSQDPTITFGYKSDVLYIDTSDKKQGSDSAEKDGGNMKDKDKKGLGKKKRKKKLGRKPTFLGVLFGITFAFVLASGAFVGYMFWENKPFEQVPEVEMPELEGLTYEEIINNTQFDAYNFSFEIVEQEYNRTYAQGEVYQQYPTAGKNVKEGITIQLSVSLGIQSVTLPDFAGDEEALTAAKLQEMGLSVQTTTLQSDTVKAGMVIDTDPPANTTVPVGSTVMLNVSAGDGKQKVSTPNFIAQDQETAEMMIREAGLVLGNVIQRTSEFDEGIVIDQTPSYGTPVNIGTKVNIVVSTDDVVAQSAEASILCLLPQDITTSVNLVVRQDGIEISNESIVPSTKRVVSLSIPGDYGTSVVSIYLNNKLYMSYNVDFNSTPARATVSEDNSSGFTL